MAKKKKRGTDAVDTEGRRELTHNPFAALRSAQAPPGPSAPAAQPEIRESAGPEGGIDALRASQKVVVRRERAGRGGKTVTRVSGLATSCLPEVARRMKTALGCGASVEEGDLLLLGNLVDRAAEWLEREGLRRVVRGN